MDKPAFPYCYGVFRTESGAQRFVEVGLARRELFAAMAMQGILAGLPPTANYCVSESVRTAIEHADALCAGVDKAAPPPLQE